MKKIISLTFLAVLFMQIHSVFAQTQTNEGLSFVFSKFEARFYGYVKLDLVYDDSAAFPGNLIFWTNAEPPKDNQFNFTLNQTRLGFSIKGPQIFGGTPNGAVEMDFYGGGAENTPNPRLYRGFIEITWPHLYIMGGQDWDTHSWLYPTCLNFGYMSNAGNTQYRRPQLRFVETINLSQKSKLLLAQAIAMTTAGDLDLNGKNDGADAGWPTFEGRIAYENKFVDNLPFTLGFSGHYGREEIDWTGAGSDSHYASWSMVGELILPIWTYANLKGEFFWGSNLDSYYGGISQGINSTTRSAIRAIGGWAQLNVQATKKLSINIGGGQDRPYRNQISDGNRETNTVAYGNFYYYIIPNLAAAFEYAYCKTTYKNANDGDDNRFHTSFIYSF